MSVSFKVFAKPAIRILDTMLDGLVSQIRKGETEKAISTIEEVRSLFKELLKML